jgi:hypothetical protein
MSKFNVNEVVLYQNGERFVLGIVKEVIREVKHYWNGVLNRYEIHRFEYNEYEDKVYLYTHDDKVIVSLALSCDASVLTDEEILEILIENFEEYEYVETIIYRVWYPTDDTTALIRAREDTLHKIDNAYAFTIFRKQSVPDYTIKTCKVSPGEHLKAFLASVVRDYLISRYGLVDGFTYKYTDEDVDSLVHAMYFDIRDSIVESDIFYEVVEDFVNKHIKKEEEIK